MIKTKGALLGVTMLVAMVAPLDAQYVTEANLETEVQFGLSHTLSLGGVAQDLEMTDDQKSNLIDLWLMTQLDVKSAFEKFRSEFSPSIPEELKQELRDQLADDLAKIRDNEFKRLESVLNEDQIDRLKQIRFQFLKRNGTGLISIKEDLDLSDDQLKKISGVSDALKKEIVEFQASARNLDVPPAELRYNIKQIRQNAEERLLSVLTPAQRQKLKRLEGDQFEFQYGPRKPAEDQENSGQTIESGDGGKSDKR